MKFSRVKRVLTTLLPKGESALLVGSPGIGKTDLIKEVAGDLGWELIVRHPVIDDPTDYKGLGALVMRNGEQSAAFVPFEDLWRLIEATKFTLVFFDDLGQAPNLTQAGAMQLWWGKELNGKKLSDKVRFCGATNRRQDQAAVQGLITPLLNRMTVVLSLDVDVDDWVGWYLRTDLPPVVPAFVRFRPELLNKFEANRDMKPFPTPRSVAAVGRLLKYGLDDVETISGAVGEGFATEFTAFYQVWTELPERQEIYMNPDGVSVPEKPDVLYALMGSLAYGATPQVFEAIVRFTDRVPKPYQVACVKDSANRNKKIKTSKAYIQWATDNAEVFGYDME